MIGCFFLSFDQSSCPGHPNLPPFYYFQLYLGLCVFKVSNKIFNAKQREPAPTIHPYNFLSGPFFSIVR
jgi:hypothetical protein